MRDDEWRYDVARAEWINPATGVAIAAEDMPDELVPDPWRQA